MSKQKQTKQAVDPAEVFEACQEFLKLIPRCVQVVERTAPDEYESWGVADAVEISVVGGAMKWHGWLIARAIECWKIGTVTEDTLGPQLDEIQVAVASEFGLQSPSPDPEWTNEALRELEQRTTRYFEFRYGMGFGGRGLEALTDYFSGFDEYNDVHGRWVVDDDKIRRWFYQAITNEIGEVQEVAAMLRAGYPISEVAAEIKKRDESRGETCRIMRLAEEHCKNNPYPGVNALTRLTGCKSTSTMRAAIRKSTKLRKLKHEHDAQQGRGSETVLNEATMESTPQSREVDPVEAAGRDELFQRLLDQATPDEQKALRAMPRNKREELIVTALNDPDAGYRVRSRA